MDSSSVCVRKLGLKWWRKTQEITLKTLLINSPFNWKYLLSNKWRKLLNRVGKTGSKTTSKSFLKQPPKAPFYRARETSRWGNFSALTAVGRPPTVRFLTVGASVDRPGRPWHGYREQALCPIHRPVNRGLSREQSSLDGRPSRSTGPPARRPPARLACTSVDRVGRPTPSSVNRSGRPAEARTGLL